MAPWLLAPAARHYWSLKVAITHACRSRCVEPSLPLFAADSQGFDPLNLSGMFSLEYMREAELKHGRICQLAAFGYAAVDNGFYAAGAPKVSSLEAHDVTVKSGHMLLLLFVIAMVEAPSYTAIAEMMSGQSDRKPGDLGIPYKFCKPGDEATMKKYQLAEITHCRAAMMGFSGMVTASAATGAPFPYGAHASSSHRTHDRTWTHVYAGRLSDHPRGAASRWRPLRCGPTGRFTPAVPLAHP